MTVISVVKYLITRLVFEGQRRTNTLAIRHLGSWREIMDMIKYSSLRSPVSCMHSNNAMACFITANIYNFTTSNIYNVHEHTLTCDLKNYMTPLRNINRRVPVEKVLYWLSKYDCNRCRYISDKL